MNPNQKKYENLLKELSNRKFNYYLFTGRTSEEPYQTEYKIIYRLITLRYNEEIIEQFFKFFACKDTNFRKSKIAHFRSSIDKAKVYYNNHRSAFDYECDVLLEQIDYFTALSVYERIVFKSILKIAKTIGQFNNLGLSIRRISNLCDISPMAVSNNLKKLSNKKILIKIKDSEKRNPAVYNINKNSLLKSIASKGIIEKNKPILSSTNQINDKKFSRGNLGKTGYLIYNLFLDNQNKEFSIEEISNILKISFATVKKKLDFLEQEGILNYKKVKTGKRMKRIYIFNIP